MGDERGNEFYLLTTSHGMPLGWWSIGLRRGHEMAGDGWYIYIDWKAFIESYDVRSKDIFA